MKNEMKRMLHFITQFLFLVFLWLFIGAVSIEISIYFSVSIDVGLGIVIGLIMILIGIYGIFALRTTLKKSKVPKLFLLIFGWLGPISACLIGISLGISSLRTIF